MYWDKTGAPTDLLIEWFDWWPKAVMERPKSPLEGLDPRILEYKGWLRKIKKRKINVLKGWERETEKIPHASTHTRCTKWNKNRISGLFTKMIHKDNIT